MANLPYNITYKGDSSMDKYKATFLDSQTNEYKTVIIESDTFRVALQKAYELMNDDDILCEIRKVNT